MIFSERLFSSGSHQSFRQVLKADLRLYCCEGLIDFGQSKQLTEEERLAFARLVIAMSKAEGAELLDVVKALEPAQQQAVSQGLQDIGIR